MKNPGAQRIVVERYYSHPPKVVFAAFSSAEAISQWLAPDDEVALKVEEFLFAVEGGYRFCYTLPDRTVLRLVGSFLLIEPDRRLSFSWCWLPPDPHAGNDSLVEVIFDPIDEGAKLTLTHSKLAAVNMGARHSMGWDGALGRLAKFLELKRRKV